MVPSCLVVASSWREMFWAVSRAFRDTGRAPVQPGPPQRRWPELSLQLAPPHGACSQSSSPEPPHIWNKTAVQDQSRVGFQSFWAGLGNTSFCGRFPSSWPAGCLGEPSPQKRHCGLCSSPHGELYGKNPLSSLCVLERHRTWQRTFGGEYGGLLGKQTEQEKEGPDFGSGGRERWPSHSFPISSLSFLALPLPIPATEPTFWLTLRRWRLLTFFLRSRSDFR